MATHSSVFAWRIPQTEEPGQPSFTGKYDEQGVGNRGESSPVFSGSWLVSLGLWGERGTNISRRYRASWASLVAQTVKNLPAMQETSVPSLGWEDPLEKGMATHSSILA